MVVTCVAFTRSVPATGAFRELPIEAAATAHLDPRYLAGARVRTGRLPDLQVDFRGRPIRLVARALHHRRVDLVDVILEIEDPEAATYLEAFDRTAAAAAAELFRVDGDRRSIAALHDAVAADLRGGPVDGRATTFQRIVFARGPEVPDGAEPGAAPGHHVTVEHDRLVVSAETTVLADERLAYEMVAGLSARGVVLTDDVVHTIDDLASAAADPRVDALAFLDRAAEAQRRSAVIQREVTAHRLLSAPLGPVHARVDEAMGVGAEGRRDLERSAAALARLTASVAARAAERRARTWQRYGLVGLLLLAVATVALLLQPLL